MDFVNLLGLVWPDGNFWANLIKIFDVGSYVWTILIFTVILKLVLSPLDFLQRFYTNKNTRMQALMQPELEKLKKRYGQNQMLLSKKQTELYSKYNFSMKGSCIVMLVYMVVTLAVFFTLFSSLQSISSFKIKDQYVKLEKVYDTSYNADFSEYFTSISASEEEYNLLETDEQKFEYIVEKYVATYSVTSEEAEILVNEDLDLFVANAQDKVVKEYDDIKDSWLWVKNIWRSDRPTINSILSHDDFVAATGFKVDGQKYSLVMGGLLSDKSINCGNGYYILSVIVVLVSLLSQFLSRKMSQPKNGSTPQPGLTKILMFVLPLTMLVFTITSSAMFSVYIIANSLISAILIPITTKIANTIEDKKEKERKDKNKAIYSR